MKYLFEHLFKCALFGENYLHFDAICSCILLHISILFLYLLFLFFFLLSSQLACLLSYWYFAFLSLPCILSLLALCLPQLCLPPPSISYLLPFILLTLLLFVLSSFYSIYSFNIILFNLCFPLLSFLPSFLSFLPFASPSKFSRSIGEADGLSGCHLDKLLLFPSTWRFHIMLALKVDIIFIYILITRSSYNVSFFFVLSISLSLSLTQTLFLSRPFLSPSLSLSLWFSITLIFSFLYQYAEYAVQLQQEIHDAGYHVDVDESARTLNKKVMPLFQLAPQFTFFLLFRLFLLSLYIILLLLKQQQKSKRNLSEVPEKEPDLRPQPSVRLDFLHLLFVLFFLSLILSSLIFSFNF